MSVILSRSRKAFEAMVKLMIAKDGPRPGRLSRGISRGKSSKPSRLGLIAGLVRRLRGR